MNTISDYYKYSELAFASYSNLTSGMSLQDYIQALQNAGKGLSLIQAENFANTYAVKDQYNDPNGLSVTLFEDGSGNQTVAIRGTQDINDIITDIIDIGILGTDEHQNQYQSLSTKVQEWLDNGTLNTGFTVTGHSLGGFLATNLAFEYAADVEHTYIYNASGVTGVGGDILAAIVAALAPGNPIAIPPVLSISNIIAPVDIISDVGLYISSPIEVATEAQSWWGAHRISGLTDTLAVYNLFSQIDPSLTVAELSTILKTAADKADHTLESAVTSLGKLLVSGFSPRTENEYNTNRDYLYTDVNAIANEINSTSGLTIEAFATADEDGNITPLSASDLESLASTDIAYRYALANLNSFAVIGANYDRFNQDGELDRFDPATGIGQLSDRYLADRAGMLYHLITKNLYDGYNESIIRYEDKASGEVVVKPDLTAPQLSVVFGTDQADQLDGTQPSSQPGDNFNDRLYGMGGNDTLNGHGGDDKLEGGRGRDTMHGGEGNDTFYIQGTDTDYDIFNGGGGLEDKILGSSGTDTIRVHQFTGDNRVEIINGGGGVDVIAGTDMADTINLSGIALTGIQEIRGGEEADAITGSGGDDTIYGDSGNDILTGGGGVDNLYGGADRDIFVLGDGTTHVYDDDDDGVLRDIEGNLLSGDWIKIDDDVYQNRLTGVEGTLAGSTFTIDFGGGNSAVIHDFEEGRFGIRFFEEGEETPDPEIDGITKEGDYALKDFYNDDGDVYHKKDELGNWIVDEDRPEPGREDILFDSTGNDELAGREGNDLIHAIRGGDDTLLGGAGDDWIEDAQGNNYLIGGEGSDVLFGGDGNDTLYADEQLSKEEILEAYAQEEATGERGDLLSGYEGNDLLYGWHGNDALSGGAGNDTIYGGAGDDTIERDYTIAWDDAYIPWTVNRTYESNTYTRVEEGTLLTKCTKHIASTRCNDGLSLYSL